MIIVNFARFDTRGLPFAGRRIVSSPRRALTSEPNCSARLRTSGISRVTRPFVRGARNGMKARIVPIGNSGGIRIPVGCPRAGWVDAFRAMAAHGDDEMLDESRHS